MASGESSYDDAPPPIPANGEANPTVEELEDHLAAAANVFDQLATLADAEIRTHLAYAGVGLAALNRAATGAIEDHLAQAVATHQQMSNEAEAAIASQLQLAHEKMAGAGVPTFQTVAPDVNPETATVQPVALPPIPALHLPPATNGLSPVQASAAPPIALSIAPTFFKCSDTPRFQIGAYDPQKMLVTWAWADGVLQPLPAGWLHGAQDVVMGGTGSNIIQIWLAQMQAQGYRYTQPLWATPEQTAAACLLSPPVVQPPPQLPNCPPPPCLPICPPAGGTPPTQPGGPKQPPGEGPPPEQPPAEPPKLPPGGLVNIESIWPNWNSLEVCKQLSALNDMFAGKDVDEGLRLLGLLTENGEEATPQWAEIAGLGITLYLLSQSSVGQTDITITALTSNLDHELKGPVVQAFAWVIAKIARTALKYAIQLAAQTPSGADCNLAPMWIPLAVRAAVHLLEHWTGIRLEDTETTIKYWISYLCPTEIPDAAEIDELLLTNQIDTETWRCMIRANNVLDKWRETVLYAKRTRPRIDEILRLWNRQKLTDQEMMDALRGGGVIDSDDAGRLIQLAEEIPTISDVIHFMVRNVGDEDLATAFNLDAEFTDKFSKQLADWAHGNGLRDDAIKMFWRAHWVVPSPGQLYQSMQRFNQDAVNTDINFRGEDGKVNPAWQPGMITQDMVTTAQDVDRALGENDVAPFWRNKLVGLSFNPMTRRDAQIAYRMGVLKFTNLPQIFRAVGYSIPDANRLAEVIHRQAVEQLKNDHDVKLYEQGFVNRDVLEQKWFNLGRDVRLTDDVLNNADLVIASAVNAKCIKALEERVMKYELRPDEAAAELVGKGIDHERSDLFAQQWRCELDAKGKRLPVQELNKLLQQGIISVDYYALALGNLGYTSADANLLAASQGIDLLTKQLKAADRAQRAAEAEARKAQRSAEKAAADADKMAKARAAKAAKAAADEAKSTSRWTQISARIARKLGRDPKDFAGDFTATVSAWRERYGWDDTVISGMMNAILATIEKKAPHTWEHYVNAAVAAQEIERSL